MTIRREHMNGIGNGPKGFAMVLVAALFVALLAVPAAAEQTRSDGLGDSEDALTGTSECPAGTALTGVRANLLFPHWANGGVVGSIAAVCGETESGFIGTSGDAAPDEYSVCPDGQVVVGLGGRSGDLVDAISVLCQALNASGLPEGDITAGVQVGGTGGGVSAGVYCPQGDVAVGLAGTMGPDFDGTLLLTFVQLVCETPVPPPPPPTETVGNAPISPLDKVPASAAEKLAAALARGRS